LNSSEAYPYLEQFFLEEVPKYGDEDVDNHGHRVILWQGKYNVKIKKIILASLVFGVAGIGETLVTGAPWTTGPALVTYIIDKIEKLSGTKGLITMSLYKLRKISGKYPTEQQIWDDLKNMGVEREIFEQSLKELYEEEIVKKESDGTLHLS
jgi:hypothetical protein